MAQSEKGTNKGVLNLGSDTGTSPYEDDIGTSLVNFGGKPPISYIQFLVGDFIFDLFGDNMINDAFERAFIDISGLMRDDVLLENLTETTRYYLTNSATYGATGFMNTYSKRILKVLRQNTEEEATYSFFFTFLNSSSNSGEYFCFLAFL